MYEANQIGPDLQLAAHASTVGTAVWMTVWAVAWAMLHPAREVSWPVHLKVLALAVPGIMSVLMAVRALVLWLELMTAVSSFGRAYSVGLSHQGRRKCL